MWLVFALLAALFWGLNYSLAERVLSNVSTYTLLALEMILGAIIFSVLAYCTTLKEDLHRLSIDSNLLWITIAEVVIVIFASYLIVVSIQAKNATAAGIIELIYPIFTIFFTWFLFRESHVDSSVVIGGILIFIGVLLISIE